MLKDFIKSLPLIGDLSVSINRSLKKLLKAREIKKFQSGNYWESRYLSGGTSGDGSYNRLAEFKAEIINKFVDEEKINSIIEFGCGDGNQLKLSRYPNYIGFDVSKLSVEICRGLFSGDKTKTFRFMDEYAGEKCECALSLDVIYHLIEDEVFDQYMEVLFSCSERFVVIYASNTNDQSLSSAIHVRHRKFSEWVEKNCPDWILVEHMPNRYPYNGDTSKTSFSDFYIYGRNLK